MSRFAKSRRSALLLPLGLLMLSMAVFGWGLQYKLSLYQSKNASQRSAPEAKLLSQKERAAAIEAHSQLAETPMWRVVCFLAFAFSAYRAVRRSRRAACFDTDWSPQPSRYRRFFVRPPPSLSFSF